MTPDSSVSLAGKGVIKQANGAQVVCFTRDLSQVGGPLPGAAARGPSSAALCPGLESPRRAGVLLGLRGAHTSSSPTARRLPPSLRSLPQTGRTGVKLGSSSGPQAVLDMIYTASSSTSLSGHLHSNAYQCGASVNLVTGQAQVQVSDLPRLITIHGALMLAAWVALLPAGGSPAQTRRGGTREAPSSMPPAAPPAALPQLRSPGAQAPRPPAAWPTLLPRSPPAGALLARSKTLLEHKGALWFKAHVSLQYAGLAAFLAGIILAWAKFPDGSGGSTGRMYNAHWALGIVVTVLAGLQVRGGAPGFYWGALLPASAWPLPAALALHQPRQCAHRPPHTHPTPPQPASPCRSPLLRRCWRRTCCAPSPTRRAARPGTACTGGWAAA